MNYMKPAVILLFSSLMIFYTGCASTNKQKKRPKRPSDATMSFFDDEPKKADTGLTGRKIIEKFEKGEYEVDPEKKIIKKGLRIDLIGLAKNGESLIKRCSFQE